MQRPLLTEQLLFHQVRSMATESIIFKLNQLEPGQMADCFALLSAKDQSKTRDGKPYYRVSFRDSVRTVTAMIWSDTA
jgi:3'-5' exoribonuclease